jgi:hypothetical protein
LEHHEWGDEGEVIIVEEACGLLKGLKKRDALKWLKGFKSPAAVEAVRHV